MHLDLRKSWTLSFVRKWWGTMDLLSTIRFRNHFVRSSRAEQTRHGTLRLRMRRPVRGTVLLREAGTDVLTFTEIMEEQVYRPVLQHVAPLRTVVDLGAHIGLASLYIAAHAPDCRILAVEPNPENYRLLIRNLQPLIEAGRCRTLNAAIWRSPARLITRVEDERYSATQVQELPDHGDVAATIPGVTMSSVLDYSGFDVVDLLKVDIEGSELHLFSVDLTWLERVRAIAIEFHDNSREQCGFDTIMRQHGLELVEEGGHTVVVLRKSALA